MHRCTTRRPRSRVITRDQIDDRQPRTLSELARSDAALGDNYAPVGYYQDIAIRGFALDLATGYRLNDMSIIGEQLIALEDKQRVEILKGLGGLEAGVVAPGGLVNYVSKRPADVRSATVGTDSHGSRYAAVDIGGWLSPTFGVRVNAAHEDMHSYVDHADGRRNFVSLAADWKISSDATLQLDTDYQTSGQRSVSGYQLLGGTTIPAHPSRSRMLGFEPWQQPVGIDASNTTARFNYRFSDDWSAQLSAGHSRSVIDDNVAFAYGCFYSPPTAPAAPRRAISSRPTATTTSTISAAPDDTRQNDEARAVLKGGFDTGTRQPRGEPGRQRIPPHDRPAPLRLRLRRHRQHRSGGSALLRAVAEPARPVRAHADQLAALAVRARSRASGRAVAAAGRRPLRAPARAQPTTTPARWSATPA